MHNVVLSHVFSTRSFARRHGPNDGPADRTQTNADVVDVAGHIVAPGMIDLGVGLGLQ